MIHFDLLEAGKEKYREAFLKARPFPHLYIDGFCDPEKLGELYDHVPEINTRSADYIFAKNKFEKSSFQELGGVFQELIDDILSERFLQWVRYVTNEDVFIDPGFYAGGIHIGKKKSYLDMHADLNYHPLQHNWFRNLNLLLYINKGWKPEHKGNLRLKDSRTGEETEVEVPFNRFVVMHTRTYTLHGYDLIDFPDGKNRTSIAAYGYTIHTKKIEAARTTKWSVGKRNPLKYVVSKIWVPVVKVKSIFFRSTTAKH